MSDFVWTDREVRAALGLDESRADEEVRYTGIATDSRTVKEGELFVALVGDRFDGHAFVGDALARGASGAVVSHSVPGDAGARLYPVDDTLVALGGLGARRRSALNARVVGITGSSGKTTTKDLTRGAVAGSRRVHATRGNLNNRIGLPLTLLAAPADAEVVILEMGTNEPGEIAALTAIARPDVGVVTTVGETHLDRLRDREGVFREKLALLRGLPADGHAVVSDDPPELAERARALHAPVRVAGWSEAADEDLRPAEAGSNERGHFHFRWRGQDVVLRIAGRHAVVDALLALAVAELLEVEPEAAARGVSGVPPAPMRGEIREVGPLTVLLDCYNANPQSVRAALDLLASYPVLGCRVAVLGTMLELGERSDALHDEVLRDALLPGLDLLVATGAFAAAAERLGSGEPSAEGIPADGRPRVLTVEDPTDAYQAVRPHLAGGGVLLLKASRGVAMERMLPRLEADFDRAGGSGAGEAD